MKTSVVLFAIFLCYVQSDPDYYWRDYRGKIPHDAVEVGVDSVGEPIYVGQAFVLHHGLLVGKLSPGQRVLVTSKEGIHRTDVYNKILCSGHKGHFHWEKANARTLHLTTIHKHLVNGGVEWNKVTNIGRMQYQGEIVIGKVCSGTVGNAKLYVAYKNEEIDTEDYEVLVYEDNDVPTIN